MDAAPASPPPAMVAGPPPLWRLAERRSRKAGSGNIFSNVNLCQLQRLFRVAGDQDAEQRANLVWGHQDETELAQALIELRAKSHRRGLRTSGRDRLGSHWLKAFNHLRIGDAGDRSDELKEEPGSCDQLICSTDETEMTLSALEVSPSQNQAETSDRATRSSLGQRRGRENDPERYLHRIIH